MRKCQICGSLACEWDGGVQLGCTDCGYDVAEEIVSKEKLDVLLVRAERSTLDQWEQILFDGAYEL